MDLARETGELDAKLAEATSWKRRVCTWLRKRHRQSDDDEAELPVRKKHRTKAREWLLAADNFWKLQTVVKRGAGLSSA